MEDHNQKVMQALSSDAEKKKDKKKKKVVDLEQLQKDFIDLMQQLFSEEFVDCQIKVIQSLDMDFPGFLSDIHSTYFQNTEKHLSEISNMFDEQVVNFQELGERLIMFKGSSSSLGFRRVHNACLALMECCTKRDEKRCAEVLQQLKEEIALLKSRLEPLTKLEKKILKAGGSLPSLPDTNELEMS